MKKRLAALFWYAIFWMVFFIFSRLLFILNDDQVLATLDISQEELPGPGQKKRFMTQLTSSQVPLGDVLVSAHIEPVRNEQVCNNNWSLNFGQLSNTIDPPARVLAFLEFQPWRLAAKKLSTTIQMTNLQKQHLRNLRLLLLKNDALVREWKALQFSPQASSHARYEEERQPSRGSFGIDRFRAILTSNTDSASPPENSILDSRARNLYWVEMSEQSLQSQLAVHFGGLNQGEIRGAATDVAHQ